MIKKTIVRTSIILYLITMILFFIVQLLFRTQDYVQFSEYQYLLATSICNSFVITTLYALFAANNMLVINKKTTPTFLQIFGVAFSPGVIAGTLTLISVFALFTYVENNGANQLFTEFLDYSLAQAKENGNYNELSKILNTPQMRSYNMLNTKMFSMLSIALVFFNFSLGLLISFLWKIRTTPKAQ